jgi:hypothetical protein
MTFRSDIKAIYAPVKLDRILSSFNKLTEDLEFHVASLIEVESEKEKDIARIAQEHSAVIEQRIRASKILGNVRKLVES